VVLSGTRRVVFLPRARFFSRTVTTPSARFTSSQRARIISLLRAPVWAAKQNMG
jgi:hypothetical protein